MANLDIIALQTCPACHGLSPRLLKYHTRRRAAWRSPLVRVHNEQQRGLHVGEASAPPPKPVSLPLWQKGLGVAAISAAAAFLIAKQLTKKKHDSSTESTDKTQEPKGSHHESKDFKAAVARTRQAVSVQKAIGFMDASSPAKAMVELRHALEENGIARGPLLNNKCDKHDRLRLYRLHLQNTEVPPNFAILLQLREMLAISESDAEQLETEVLESGSAFSI